MAPTGKIEEIASPPLSNVLTLMLRSLYKGHGKPQSLAVVEGKVPSTTFPKSGSAASVRRTGDDHHRRIEGRSHPRTRTYVNVTYAVDGAWGIEGKAYTNADRGAAIASG
jgi:hypothetical protein